MYYESPYDTEACAYIARPELISSIQKAHLQGELHAAQIDAGRDDEGFTIYLVYGGSTFSDEIKFFSHPIYVSVPDTKDEEILVVDVRNYGSWDAPNMRFKVRNAPEYAFAIRRAILTHLANSGRPEVLRDISNIPAMTYVALITEAISHRFGADPAERSTISALVAYYYYSLFRTVPMNVEQEMPMLMGKIAKMTAVPLEYVKNALADMNAMLTLQDLCDEIVKKVNSPAFSSLNLGVLFTLVNGSWMGGGTREVVTVGLQHVPTWLMLCEAGLVSRTYKKTTLARVAQRFDKGTEGRSFVRAMDVLCGGHDAVEIDGKVDTYYQSQARL
jgi:hypothetical protein